MLSDILYSPLVRGLVAAGVAGLLAVRGRKSRSLSPSGAAAAFVVGAVTMGASYMYGVTLIAFYLLGSRLTRYKAEVKAKLDLQHAGEATAGNRSAEQVLATAGLTTLLAAAHAILTESSPTLRASPRIALDVASDLASPAGAISALCIAYMCACACVCGDTCASELGILSRGQPLLLTSICGCGRFGASTGGKQPPACCRRVPRGTNGGVSLLGIAVSFAGGAFIGVVAYGCILLQAMLAKDAAVDEQQWMIVPIAAAAGGVGSVIDSVAGAWLQCSWYDARTGKTAAALPPDAASYVVLKDSVEAMEGKVGTTAAGAGAPAHAFARVCGYDVLSNEGVNALSSALTALLGVASVHGVAAVSSLLARRR